jgi:hypothetical protein
MSTLIEIVFVVIVAVILAIAALIAPTHDVQRRLDDQLYCTGGFRPIVHRARVVGCQRGWQG